MSETDEEDVVQQAVRQAKPLRGKPVPELGITPADLCARAEQQTGLRQTPPGITPCAGSGRARRVLKTVGETTVGVCAAGLALATLAWIVLTVTAPQNAWAMPEVAMPALLIVMAAGYLLAAIGRDQVRLRRRKGSPVSRSRDAATGGDTSGGDDSRWRLAGIAAVHQRTYRILLCAPGDRVQQVDVVLESASMTGGLLPQCVAFDMGLLPAAVDPTVMGALWAFHNASQAPEPATVLFRANLREHAR